MLVAHPITLQTSNLLTKPQREALRDAIKRGLAPVRIPAPLKLSDWADSNFYLSNESSAIEGPWECWPFQVEILNAIGNDDIRIIDWVKCSRVGYTKILMASAAYFLEHKKRSGAIYQPTDDDAKEFSKAEIDPMIRDVKPLREAYGGDPEKRGRKNNVHLKQFLAVMLYIRGGHSGRSFRRLTIDWVFYDELEAFQRDVDGEGDPVSLGDGRITNSPTPKSVRGSTPKLKHDSLIYKEAETARHQFHYHVHCIHCLEPQTLEWSQIRWHDNDATTAHYVCPHCSGVMEYRDLRPMLDAGFWGTRDGYRIEDGALLDPEGMPAPWPRHIAFFIWAAYSLAFTWSELVDEFLEAVSYAKQGDIRKLKTWTNTRKAEAWEEKGEQVAHDALYLRRETYTRPPATALLLTASFDVQDNRIEGEVVAWREGFESWGIEYRVIYGDPTQPEVWAELDAFICQTWTTEDGRKLKIAGVIIDSGHLASHVYAFYKRTMHPRVFVTKGIGGSDKPIVSAPQQRKAGKSKAPVPLFLHGADVCKAMVYKRLAITEPGPGYMHFPDSYSEDYFRGLTAEKKTTRKRRGFDVIEWIKERARNEQLDVWAMSLACVEILNPLWDALKPRALTEPEPKPENVNPAARRKPRTDPYRNRRGLPKR